MRRPQARLALAGAVGYMLGSFPSADLAARFVSGGTVDLRAEGSGNPGAMNVARLLGRRVGLLVSAADIGKGSVACLLGRALAGDEGAHAGGVAAVAGHCYPPWSRFEGGKGVATSFGQCLATFPAYAPADLALAVAVNRLARLRRPVLATVSVSSAAWILAGIVWWKKRLPNLWGPTPSASLPLANAATSLVIAFRAVRLLGHAPDKLTPPQ